MAGLSNDWRSAAIVNVKLISGRNLDRAAIFSIWNSAIKERKKRGFVSLPEVDV